MADTTDLYFDLPAALRLAEHAAAAPEQAPSYTEHTDGVACRGALVFVKDDGVYLMSSGQPGLMRPDADGHQVVYAYGWTPPSLRNPRLTHLGGDDFAEHLHLSEPLNSDGGTLLDGLRDGHARGHRYLVLQVGHTAFDISISRGGPPGT
jgi:hypothetical protein